MNNPKEFTQRDAINSLTGIKSSLSKIRTVISLTYLLYLANNKKSSIVYAESEDSKIVLKQEYKTFIQQFLNNEEVIKTIDKNPLLTNQIESLYVGLTLMFALGRISFENSSLSMTKERTGGVRYPKKIDFASNIMILDLMLSADSENSVKETLIAWLQNKSSENEIEQRISIFLNISIENNLFKLRHGNNDLYFQTEGIYKSLLAGNEVSLETDEVVGPTRILNSMLKEKLVPWLNFSNSILTVKENNDFNVKEYSDIVSTSLSIRDIKVDNNEESALKEEDNNSDEKQLPLQQITYGAPGTGKSHEIKKKTARKSVIRTTFHPDSDYSTFVGAYKPTMEETPVYGAQGVEVAKEKRITYTYIKQAFLKAYLGAWQKYAKGGETTEPQFLVIEEINRGNCAQIFGDIFQLLDRGENGFSTYPIEADSDLQSEIKAAFADGGEYALENELAVDSVVDEYTSNYGESLSADIKNGRVLLLPNNLYIWATMNTSDQSLFPIDSAFKRRWDWRYVKIADAGKRWKIKCGNECCDWWKFVEEINKRIAKETSSDDKKLGYFFCKPPKDSNVIDEDKFVGKVLFYLWNDVFKDGDISLFKVSDDENAEICFDAFYDNDNNVNVKAIRNFLAGVVGEDNIKTETVQDSEEEKNNDDGLMEDDDGNTKTSSNKNYDKFTINDGPEYGKNKLALECIRKYIELNPNVTAKDVYDIWSSLGIRVPHFIETKEEYDARKDNSKRSKAIECHGTTLYIACNGYGSNGRADELMNSVNEKEWGLTIKKVIK